MAAQPEPGLRLLHAETPSRKYPHRTRCITLPAVVALLRSWVLAPDSSACDSAG
ncbi:hypothetical protein D9M72_589140 [compost metagenome]